MDSSEITFWVESRRYKALQKALGGADYCVERELKDCFGMRYRELVPAEEREQIESAIAEEDRLAQAEYEANRRFSVARVTENGQTNIYLREKGESLYDTAQRLRNYIRDKEKWGSMYPDKPDLSEPEMERYVAEAIRGSERVVGVYDIDLDAGELSTLDGRDGWHAYKIKDISTAIYFATKKESDSWVAKRNRFNERMKDVKPLDARHPVFIRGDQPLPVESLFFEEKVSQMDHLLNFYIPVYFDVDAVCGTHVNTDENDDCVNVYANYDMEQGCVCDSLDVYLMRGDGSEVDCQFRLTPEECATLLPMMDDYCKKAMGLSIDECRTEYLAEEQGSAPQKSPADPTLQM